MALLDEDRLFPLEGRARGSIVTRAFRGDERTFLEVEDDGPGLHPQVIDRVFEPLVTGKATGTGLGLALCRVIVEAHGGEITATTSPRGGTAFHLWLPNAQGCCTPFAFQSDLPPG